jgi:hypothetical protein
LVISANYRAVSLICVCWILADRVTQSVCHRTAIATAYSHREDVARSQTRFQEGAWNKDDVSESGWVFGGALECVEARGGRWNDQEGLLTGLEWVDDVENAVRILCFMNEYSCSSSVRWVQVASLKVPSLSLE